MISNRSVRTLRKALKMGEGGAKQCVNPILIVLQKLSKSVAQGPRVKVSGTLRYVTFAREE